MKAAARPYRERDENRRQRSFRWGVNFRVLQIGYFQPSGVSVRSSVGALTALALTALQFRWTVSCAWISPLRNEQAT